MMDTGDLFGGPPEKFTRRGDSIVPPTKKEIEKAAPKERRRSGAAARDAGAKAAADHADAVNADSYGPSWSDCAYTYFCAFARTRLEFRTEQAREWAESKGFAAPPDKRAWGAIAMRARKDGIVRKNGIGTSEDPKAHCGFHTIWTLVRG